MKRKQSLVIERVPRGPRHEYELTDDELARITACKRPDNETFWQVLSIWQEVAERLGFHVLTVHHADPARPNFTAVAKR